MAFVQQSPGKPIPAAAGPDNASVSTPQASTQPVQSWLVPATRQAPPVANPNAGGTGGTVVAPNPAPAPEPAPEPEPVI